MTKTDEELIARLERAYKIVRSYAGQLIVRELPDPDWLPAADAIEDAIAVLRASPAPLQAQTSVPAGMKPIAYVDGDGLVLVPDEQAAAFKQAWDALPELGLGRKVLGLCLAASPAPASAQVTEEPQVETAFANLVKIQFHAATGEQAQIAMPGYIRALFTNIIEFTIAARAALHPGREER